MAWVLQVDATVPGGLPDGIEDALGHRLAAAGIVHDSVSVNAGPSLAVTLIAPQHARDRAEDWAVAVMRDALRAELGAVRVDLLVSGAEPALEHC